MKTIIGVDPSINLCGYSVFYRKSLVDFGLIQTPQTKNLEEKCLYICRFLKKKVESFKDEGTVIAIEMPTTWSTSRGVPAKYGGALQKLFFCVGVLYGKLNNKRNKVILIPVGSWKGNAPKEVTFKRMAKKYKLRMDPTSKNFNVVDAIGIGDHVLSQKIR